jgi:hypothetical protein
LGLASHVSVAAAASGIKRIWGGQEADTCAFPATVALGHCTATLIHPRVILSAAHCNNEELASVVRFGENYAHPARSVAIESCKSFPDFDGDFGAGTDWSYCILSESVDDVPIVPPAMGCELEALTHTWQEDGLELTLVGFGRNEANVGGVKRSTVTQIRSVANGELETGGNGKSGCFGDSGGSAYVQLGDGTWRLMGVISYARGACGTPEYIVLAHRGIQWIEDELADFGIDLTPCTDKDGVWQDTPACTDLPTNLRSGGSTWENGCADLPRAKSTTSCNPEFIDAEFRDDMEMNGLDPDWEPTNHQDLGTSRQSNDSRGKEWSCSMSSADPHFTPLLLLVLSVLAPVGTRSRGRSKSQAKHGKRGK